MGAPPKPTIHQLGFLDKCLLGPTVTAIGAVCHQAPASTKLQSGLFGGSERTEAMMVHHLFPVLDGSDEGSGVHDVGLHNDDERMKFENEARNKDDQFVTRIGPGGPLAPSFFLTASRLDISECHPSLRPWSCTGQLENR